MYRGCTEQAADPSGFCGPHEARYGRFVWQDGDITITPPPRVDEDAELQPSVDGSHLPNMQFRDAERRRAVAWKQTTPDLTEAARADARYVGKKGPQGDLRDFCLPADHAEENLFPSVRAPALALFRELGIPWHSGVAPGQPGNHLLSSQVQCANALTPMIQDPEAIRTAFGQAVDIDTVLEIEPGRSLTFEYIGPTDFFGEGRNSLRIPGAYCTSIDAAFVYRTSTGQRELALVEWKYTEQYLSPRKPQPAKDQTRRKRYHQAWQEGPLRTDIVPFEDMLDEPFYQLMRQQLLAWKLEQAKVCGVSAVRVIHVHPAANAAYQRSLTRDSHRAAGDTVSEVWRRMLGASDRYVELDAAHFTDPAITSTAYASRYGLAGAA
jgi:hypothetical protein